MVAKEQRQQIIRQLVDRGEVRRQHDLQCALRQKRIAVDQSTLSRDLHELGIHKSDGRYRRDPRAAQPGSLATLDYSSFIRRFTACGPNLIVLHTEVGQAPPVAIALDEARDPSIAGTVAGDDTVLIATRSRAQQALALARLRDWFGEKQE